MRIECRAGDRLMLVLSTPEAWGVTVAGGQIAAEPPRLAALSATAAELMLIPAAGAPVRIAAVDVGPDGVVAYPAEAETP